jgi:hypothetical protein
MLGLCVAYDVVRVLPSEPYELLPSRRGRSVGRKSMLSSTRA